MNHNRHNNMDIISISRRPTRARHKKNFPWPTIAVLATAVLFYCWNGFLPITVAAAAQSTAATPSYYACDESKCRATRAHPWVDNDVEYTCWIPQEDVVVNASGVLEGDEYCADDYIGRIVEEVPSTTIETASGEIKTAVWYTCCPPEYTTGPVHQTCSDTACSSPDWEGGGNCWADGFQEPMSCDDAVFRYPRYTGLKSLIYIQFLCCDAPQQQGDNAYMDELLIARIVWMVLSGITFVVCTIFIASLLSCKKARLQGYNLYLVFLAIPDALANGMILVRNALTISGVPVSPTVFVVLASFEYFYAASNMWLNGVIVRQIHIVLYKSRHFVKTSPPSVKKVCLQATLTYVIAVVFFGWAMYLYLRGLVDFSLTAVVNIWICTRVVMVAPPFFYVSWVCFDVWHHELLPRTGRTRVLSLYFLRVIIVFIVTWVPYYIIYEIAWNVTYSEWMVHGSYYLGSVQGSVSVLVAMSKPDVKRAVKRFITCRCRAPVDPSIRNTRWGRSCGTSGRSHVQSSSANNNNNNTSSGPFTVAKAAKSLTNNRASTQAPTVTSSSRQFHPSSSMTTSTTKLELGRSAVIDAMGSDGGECDSAKGAVAAAAAAAAGEDRYRNSMGSGDFSASNDDVTSNKPDLGGNDVEAAAAVAVQTAGTLSSQENEKDKSQEPKSSRPKRRVSIWEEDDVYHETVEALKEIAAAEETNQSSNDTKK